MDKTLGLQLMAGRVKRYHNHSIIGEQTVGEHTYGMVQIIRCLTDDDCSGNLLKAALDHDVPEAITGDIPFTAKKGHPELKIAVDNVEAEVEKEYGLQRLLNAAEYNVLKQADLLEMGFFGINQMRLGNKYGGGDVVVNVLEALGKLRPTINGQILATMLEDMYHERK